MRLVLSGRISTEYSNIFYFIADTMKPCPQIRYAFPAPAVALTHSQGNKGAPPKKRLEIKEEHDVSNQRKWA